MPHAIAEAVRERRNAMNDAARENDGDITLIRQKQLSGLLGINRATCWRWIKSGVLPRPIRLSERVVGWRLKDVQDFLEARARAANAEERPG